MKSKILFLFLAFVIAVNGQNGPVTTDPPTSTPTTPTTPTQAPNTTTTAATTQTPQATNATTTATHNATTDMNNTTTHEMTTQNTSSTTPAVTTVTTQSTTMKPTPPPAQRQFFFVNDSGVVCVLLNMTTEFMFKYKDDKNDSQTYSMPLPDGAKASGKCNISSPYMTIEFGKNKDMLTMHFTQKDGKTYIENVSLNFTMDSTFPGITGSKKESAMASGPFYKFTSGSAFTCKSNQTMELKGDVDVTVSTIDLELEAFRTKNDTTFSDQPVNCAADSATSNIVPIAVGAALAALVVIVLIAYLISRNRNKRGYESV